LEYTNSAKAEKARYDQQMCDYLPPAPVALKYEAQPTEPQQPRRQLISPLTVQQVTTKESQSISPQLMPQPQPAMQPMPHQYHQVRRL
jgi:hypothetical protein